MVPVRHAGFAAPLATRRARHLPAFDGALQRFLGSCFLGIRLFVHAAAFTTHIAVPFRVVFLPTTNAFPRFYWVLCPPTTIFCPRWFRSNRVPPLGAFFGAGIGAVLAAGLPSVFFGRVFVELVERFGDPATRADFGIDDAELRPDSWIA